MTAGAIKSVRNIVIIKRIELFASVGFKRITVMTSGAGSGTVCSGIMHRFNTGLGTVKFFMAGRTTCRLTYSVSKAKVMSGIAMAVYAICQEIRIICIRDNSIFDDIFNCLAAANMTLITVVIMDVSYNTLATMTLGGVACSCYTDPGMIQERMQIEAQMAVCTIYRNRRSNIVTTASNYGILHLLTGCI